MAGIFDRLTRSAALCAAVALGSIAGAPGARADGLREAMAEAYANSPVLDQQRYLLRIEDEGVAQAVAQLRPTLSFVANADRDLVNDTTTSTASLVAEWVLYSGGSRRLALEAAQATVRAAREGLVSVEQQVLLDAVRAYLSVWSDLQVVNVREANVRVVTQQLRAARDRFEVGEDTRTDVAQAEARLAQARSALAAARGQLEISRELFALAIGRYPGSLAGPGALPGLPRSEAEADALARQNTPGILRLQFEVQATDLSVERARAAYRPTISLDGAVSNTFESPQFGREGESASIGLTLRQPIYRGGQLASLERQALAQSAAVRASLNQQTRIAIQTMGNAWAQLRIANAQIQAADQQISAAELAFEGVREEASLGARTTLDVLDAEQDVLDARISRIEAQANLYLAAYSILSAGGLLTVRHLDLDVPGYDPSVYYDLVDDAPTSVPSVQGQRLDSVLGRIGRD
ncbi:TolC family outer membrane protein [Roseibacterium sp. SDUM158017]|uniref:TolC family outer membrane protein n=1 Tax=Roseicyclus salinarum TaxID=3036773 RepID=UPI0024157FC5|nr:TolC family outer membrane protein [Roseibacterium sp. SDUM158017]MDG4648527.1 TolC family outer membrane protein [Roseibacterium sp. SDUM158017]